MQQQENYLIIGRWLLMVDLELQRELRHTLMELNSQVELIFQRARTAMVNPYDLKYADGKPVLSPILIAKADVLSALITLRKIETEEA